MDYSVGYTDALDARSSFNLQDAAALIAGINPTLVRIAEDGEFFIQRDWDCPCQELHLVRTATFGTEPPAHGSPTDHARHQKAAQLFHQWIDTLYDAIDNDDLKATQVYKHNAKEPALRNLPRYAQTDALDPKRTKVSREELTRWLKKAGQTTGYFFCVPDLTLAPEPEPAQATEFVRPYLIPGSAEYLPALHTLIQALDYKLANPGSGRTPKQRIIDYVKRHGIPGIKLEWGTEVEPKIPDLVECMAKVGNSKRSGGPLKKS